MFNMVLLFTMTLQEVDAVDVFCINLAWQRDAVDVFCVILTWQPDAP